jgi:hypothetical protein
VPGRLNLKKALVVVAAQEDGPGIGRIRMRQIIDASAESLCRSSGSPYNRGASSTPTVGWDTCPWSATAISRKSPFSRAEEDAVGVVAAGPPRILPGGRSGPV